MLYYTKLTYGGWGMIEFDEDKSEPSNTLINAYGIEDVEIEKISLGEKELKEKFELAPMHVILFYRNLIKSEYYKELIK